MSSTNLKAVGAHETPEEDVISTTSYALVGEDLYEVDAAKLLEACEKFQQAWVMAEGRLLSESEKEEVLRDVEPQA